MSAPDAAGGHAGAVARGRALAAFWRSIADPLFDQIGEAVALPTDSAARDAARREWECLASFAGVRALVAAGGFGSETADAVDAFHDALLAGWNPAARGGETLLMRRTLMSERYAEYGGIARGTDAHEAETAARLGEAAARRMAAGTPPNGLAEIAGSLHFALVEACVTRLQAPA